jgi:lysyl-tRNA synthetase class 1
MIDWAEEIAKDILSSRKEKYTIATGVSPSGPIHIGNMREVLIADTVYKALLELGARARLIYIADTFDPLRKLYPFLPTEYEQHVGKPLFMLPDPFGCCASYVDHFLKPLVEVLDEVDIRLELFRADELYREGKYVTAIKTSLAKRDELARIMDEVSGRTTPQDWSPFHPICGNCGKLNSTVVANVHDSGVKYKCSCGYSGDANFKGDGKLSWRVDWPARWKIFGVDVEPFGKDIGAAGGSYDSGKRVAKEIFGYEPPYPIPFEHILLKGKGKMSSSKGVALTVKELLEIMPPDVLRAILTKTKPRKHIEFDPGLNLINTIDEFDAKEVPMKHMINVVQISPDFTQRLDVLKRSGYDVSDETTIKRRAEYAENWLNRYAPQHVKFSIQKTLPDAAKNLDSAQKGSLRALAEKLGKIDAEQLHNEIYTIAESTKMDKSKIFEAVYLSLLGQKSGPRAGWFLKSLDEDFVRHRLEEAANA